MSMQTSDIRRITYAIGAAFALNIVAALASGDSMIANKNLLAGTLWFLAIGILIWVGAIGQTFPRPPVHEIIIVVALAAAALLIRLYRIDQGPPIISGNEASFALNALEFLNGTRTNIFSVGWGSFPSFYSFLQSWPLRFLPQELFAIRLTSVLVGTLTVVSTYVYARSAFGKFIAAASAVVLAFLGIHIHFSRLGLNNIWDGLFAVLLALFLSKAWKSDRLASYIFPGVILGLAQFFYVGSRIFILLIPICVLLMFVLDRSRGRLRIQGLVILILSALAVALPLVLFFVRNPADFLAPMARTSVFGHWWTIQTVYYGEPAGFVIAEQIIKALLGFVIVPTTLFYAGQPILSPPLAVLFIIGLIVLVRRWREPDSFWIGLWLIGTALTVMLSDSPPAGQRYALSLGAVAIVTAHGFQAVISWIPYTWKKRRLVANTLVCLFLASTLWQSYYYFTIYPTKEVLADFNGATVAEVANSLRQYRVQNAYFFVSSRMTLASHEVLVFLLPTLSGEDIADDSRWQIEILNPGEYAFIFLPERESSLDIIRACLPGGVVQRNDAPEGYTYFLLYIVNADAPTVCTGS